MASKTPVPVGEAPSASISVTKTVLSPIAGPHELECRIQRGLQSYPGLHFSRLTVHQCSEGVCLEGLLETNEEGIDLSDLVSQIAGVKVINHVVNHPAKPK
jgi:hypothetical protein